MCVNFTIKDEEVCKYSWQFFFAVEIFENETQKFYHVNIENETDVHAKIN